jgi:hypothetical protein
MNCKEKYNNKNKMYKVNLKILESKVIEHLNNKEIEYKH